jgi:glycosyltransferase involved in cell wall biosynthesis
LIFDIPYIILKYRIDISHYQYITPLLKLSREIVTIHDVLFIDFPELFPIGYRVKNRFFFKRSARRADVLLTVSDYSRNRIAEHFKISEEDIIVIHNAVSADFFEPAGELPDVKIKFGLGNYILYVSRIEPRKNHIMLLKAFVELKLWEKNFQLVLIGGRAIPSVDFDDYLNSLSDKIRATVYLIDSSYGNELKSFYRNCRLFVFPSIAEGFGIPPLEAVASNTPMICSKSTAMGEFKFLNDRMFDPTSLDDLKEKITEYLGNTTGYSNNELDFIRLNYNWQDAAKHFYRILLESGLK